MTQLYEKSLLKLELDQVLSLLSDCAGSVEGKRACLDIVPSSDLDDVLQMQAETTAACTLVDRKGNPGFSAIRDVRDSVHSLRCTQFSFRYRFCRNSPE